MQPARLIDIWHSNKVPPFHFVTAKAGADEDHVRWWHRETRQPCEDLPDAVHLIADHLWSLLPKHDDNFRAAYFLNLFCREFVGTEAYDHFVKAVVMPIFEKAGENGQWWDPRFRFILPPIQRDQWDFENQRDWHYQVDDWEKVVRFAGSYWRRVTGELMIVIPRSRVLPISVELSHQRYKRALDDYIVGHFKSASTILSDLVLRDPDNVQAFELLACTRANLYSYHESVEVLERLREIGHECSICWTNRSVAERSRRKKDKALTAAARALELDAANSRAWLQKGLCLVDVTQSTEFRRSGQPPWDEKSLKDAAEAIDCFDRALTDPLLFRALEYKGVLLYRLWTLQKSADLFERAREAFGKLLEHAPNDRTALYHLGLLAFESDPPDLKQARDVFFALTQLFSDDPEPFAELARVHRTAGERDACLAAIRVAQSLYDYEFEELRDEFGELYREAITPLKDEELDQRIHTLRETAESNPGDYRVWEQLAWTLARSPRYAEALPAFEKLQQLKHSCLKCTMELVDIYNLLDRSWDARDLIERAPELYGHDARTWYEVGLYYADLRVRTHIYDPDKALECFARAVSIESDFYDAILCRIRMLYALAHQAGEAGEESRSALLVEQGLDAAREALKIFPADAKLWEFVALIANNCKPRNTRTAEEAYRKLVDLGHATPAIYWRLTEIFDEVGPRDEFLKMLRNAVADVDILEAARFAYRKRVDPEVREIVRLTEYPHDAVVVPSLT